MQSLLASATALRRCAPAAAGVDRGGVRAVCALTVLLGATSVVSAGTPAGFEAAAADFAAELSRRHGLPVAEVAALLADARLDPRVLAAIERPYEDLPWTAYRALFLTPERIQGGVAYQAAQAEPLARATAEFGVAGPVIVAILGIETNYGRSLGDYRALDALTTLGFAYPPRAAFFRDQLAAFLLLARQGDLDPRATPSSYAGALGKPQFLPMSWRDYAVDFDHDGRRDLFTSDADVIGSVAHYLARHGWRAGAPVAVPVRLVGPVPSGVLAVEGSPAAIPSAPASPPPSTLGELAAAGVLPEWPGAAPDLPADTPAALIRFGDGDWLLAFDNFYALTRYNNSNLYARAVLELGQAITGARSSASSAATTGGIHDHDTPDRGRPDAPD